ncbi:MAG: Ig-like domain-containing protein [Muribaculaceae bacterium]|nr:Ig-like domain-containing protein [Muribaculaceae bacterium]
MNGFSKRLITFPLFIVSVLMGFCQQTMWVGETYNFDVTSSVVGLPANLSWSTNGGYLSLSGSGFYRQITITQYFSGTATVTCEWDYKLTASGSYTHTKRQITISCKNNQVSISPTSMTMSQGEKRYVSYSHQFSNQYTSAANPYFQSTNPEVASVDMYTGEVTAISPGTAYINVYSKISSGAPYCLVTVNQSEAVPAAPSNVKIRATKNEGEVYLSWDPVTKDRNGKNLTKKVTYTIYSGESNNPIVKNLDRTNYTYNAVPKGKQEILDLKVTAVTSVGSSEGTNAPLTPIGTPYKEINETFADGKTHYLWMWGGEFRDESGVYLYGEDSETVTSVSGDNGFLGFHTKYTSDKLFFESGLVSIVNQDNPNLSFFVFNNTDNQGTLSVYIRETGDYNWTEVMTPISISDLCGVGNVNVWREVSVSLKKFLNKTVQFRITLSNPNLVYTFIDDINCCVSPSGVSEEVILDDSFVSLNGREIIIHHSEGLAISITDIHGGEIYKGIGDVLTKINVGEGIFIVKVGNKVSKILVK